MNFYLPLGEYYIGNCIFHLCVFLLSGIVLVNSNFALSVCPLLNYQLKLKV
jgi:hypothetical protein